MSKNGSKLFLASIIGALAGAVGGLLLAPKSGKELRADIATLAKELSTKVKLEAEESKQRVKDVFGNATEEAMQKYKEISTSLLGKVAKLKTTGQTIDKEKYEKVVEEVVADFKTDIKMTKTGVEKLLGYLKKDFTKIKKSLA